jgi:hypothetical protein
MIAAVALGLASLSFLPGTEVRAQGAPAPAMAENNGQAMFAEARDVWSGMSYPEALDYDVVVSVTSGNLHRSDRYTGKVRPATGDFRVSKFSETERSHSYVPHGTNVSYSIGLGLNSGKRPFGKADDTATLSHEGSIAKEKPVEPFAIPELSPLYSFGIQRCAARHARRPDDDGGLKTIGGVSSANRRYSVTVADYAAVDGQPAVHLSLVPLIDSRRDRLRDLWLSPSTHRVLQARVLGNFTGKDESAVPWLIRFSTFDGATYLDTETSEAPVRRGPAVFDRVTIKFENIKPDTSSRSRLSFAIPADFSGLNVIEEPRNSNRC